MEVNTMKKLLQLMLTVLFSFGGSGLLGDGAIVHQHGGNLMLGLLGLGRLVRLGNGGALSRYSDAQPVVDLADRDRLFRGLEFGLCALYRGVVTLSGHQKADRTSRTVLPLCDLADDGLADEAFPRPRDRKGK